jgi:hypothetical protein
MPEVILVSIDLHYYSESLQKKLELLATSKAAIIEAPSGMATTSVGLPQLTKRQLRSIGDCVAK